MDNSVEYRLGSLDARMTNVESTLGEVRTETRSQSSKLDTLIARSSAVSEFKQLSWKKLFGMVATLAAVIEGAHQLHAWLHGG